MNKTSVPGILAFLALTYSGCAILFYLVFSALAAALPSLDRAWILLPLAALFLVLMLVPSYMFLRSARNCQSNLEDELKRNQYIVDNTNEIVMVLNNLGQILSVNSVLRNLLGFEADDLANKPLREIIVDKIMDNNLRSREMILLKLKEVFSGKQTEMICSCRVKGSDEIQTISFRMIPVLREQELDHILVMGRPVENDILSERHLSRETGFYILENSISLVYMLSYRLTRNLQGRLPKSQILMAQMSLQEVLINAIEHGNLEIDYEKKTQLKKMTGKYWENLLRECNSDHLRNRKIFVSYSMDEEKVVYTIRDEGDGFDWERYITSDASSFGRELYRSYHGVGLQMVRRAFKISFRDRGNEVLLTKYFSESAGEEDS